VTWNSNNTWASTGKGEENNNFVGANRTLMTGYLDDDPGGVAAATVTFTGLPTNVVPNYSAIVYFLGGSGGRGGPYQANGQPPTLIGDVGTTGVNGPAFVLDPGLNHTDQGNFVLFTGLTSPNLTITGLTLPNATDPIAVRVPINAIEIVPTSAVPEPTVLGALALGILGVSARRRRR